MRSLIKKILKENIDDLQWMKDVLSPTDIVNEILLKTRVVPNEINSRVIKTPFCKYQHSRIEYFPSFMFKIYIEDYYGIVNRELINNIYDEYIKLFNSKYKHIHSGIMSENEDDLQWMKDIKPNESVVFILDTINDLWKDTGYKLIVSDRGHGLVGDIIEPDGSIFNVIDLYGNWKNILRGLYYNWSDVDAVFGDDDPYTKDILNLYMKVREWYHSENKFGPEGDYLR